jgi:hypothetical protein
MTAHESSNMRVGFAALAALACLAAAAAAPACSDEFKAKVAGLSKVAEDACGKVPELSCVAPADGIANGGVS